MAGRGWFTILGRQNCCHLIDPMAVELKRGQGGACEVVRKVGPLIEIKNTHTEQVMEGTEIIHCRFGMF